MPWSAWRSDWATWAWLLWLLAFVGIEGWAVITRQPVHTLTWHLRPFFTRHPLTWWLAFGCWCWLGLHFLAPRWERTLLEFLVGPAP